MSRTRAAGRMGKIAACPHPGCDFWVPFNRYQHERRARGLGEDQALNLCAEHGAAGPMVKRFGRVKSGLIDFDTVQRDLAGRQIELRGGAADETPGAYKRLDEVLAAHADTIRVRHRLTPIGVAMAGPDVHDPFKD